MPQYPIALCFVFLDAEVMPPFPCTSDVLTVPKWFISFDIHFLLKKGSHFVCQACAGILNTLMHSYYLQGWLAN